MPLNDLQCKKARPADPNKTYKISDGGGLYLEITDKGKKLWRLKFRFHGKENRASLGMYPKVSIAEARKKRDILKQQIEKGINPSVVRREEKLIAKVIANNTFELVAREWHEKMSKSVKWSKGYSEDVLRRLEFDLFPRVGKLPISNLTPPILYQSLSAIADRSKDQAKRCRQLTGQILRYAVITGRAQRDITPDLRGTFDPIIRTSFASIAPDDIGEFMYLLNTNEPRVFRQTIIATKILMLTFVRTTELLKAKWHEFDLDKAQWIVPAERMKKRRDHVVPLAKQTIKLLLELKRNESPDSYVFRGLHFPRQHMSDGTILNALKALKLKKPMTGHGFRALAMTTIKEKLGYPHEIIKKQLSHILKDATDRAYDRTEFLSERFKMMQDYADHIDNEYKKFILTL